MRLIKIRVTNFRSIVDSGEVELASVACLVGKNESGKTSFLRAVELLNPADGNRQISIVNDYPRWLYTQGQAEMNAGNPPTIVTATYTLTDDEFNQFQEVFGPNTLKSREIAVTLDYSAQKLFDFDIDEREATSWISTKSEVGHETGSAATIAELIAGAGGEERQAAVNGVMAGWAAPGNLESSVISWIAAREPKFMYFGEYSLMPGRISVPWLIELIGSGASIPPEFRTFLSLLELAGVSLESFTSDADYEAQKSKLEAAGLQITNELYKYWQQNQHSSIEFDKSGADEQAEAQLATGTNLHVRSKSWRGVSVPIDQGSHGFRWFFSFLVYFTGIRATVGNSPLVLLLDEPGGALHALAQGDFLRMLDERLAVQAQVVYTTHSPFMVDANRLERVRLVMDDPESGTVVSNQVLGTDEDTLFPLQAALGYTVGQTLFVAPNALLVEGPSDLLYLQVLSRELEMRGRKSLDSRWVIVPVGGVSKIETFARLYGANQLHLAALIDGTTKDKEQQERLAATGYLPKSKVISIGDAKGINALADIEDIFSDDLYVELVKNAYPQSAAAALTVEAVRGEGDPRLAKRVQKVLEGFNFDSFEHLKPAIALAKAESGTYTIDDDTLDRAESLIGKLNQALEDDGANDASEDGAAKKPVPRPKKSASNA